MSSYSDILADEYATLSEPRARQYVEQIKLSASRMDQLIQDLLKLGRLGSADMAAAHVKLEEIARRVLAPLERELSAKRAQVQIKEPLLPVWANEGMVEQIMANLLSNALKFSRREARPQVEMWTEDKQEWVRLCIRDNGVGIAAEHINRIFRPFEKLTTGEEASGTGIGLAIVRKGAERMGGRVGVESDPGKGSCFWIELPAVHSKGEAGN
jgi:signal transduction histidine kinase